MPPSHGCSKRPQVCGLMLHRAVSGSEGPWCPRGVRARSTGAGEERRGLSRRESPGSASWAEEQNFRGTAGFGVILGSAGGAWDSF